VPFCFFFVPHQITVVNFDHIADVNDLIVYSAIAVETWYSVIPGKYRKQSSHPVSRRWSLKQLHPDQWGSIPAISAGVLRAGSNCTSRSIGTAGSADSVFGA
jgi:hypothetical protein